MGKLRNASPNEVKRLRESLNRYNEVQQEDGHLVQTSYAGVVSVKPAAQAGRYDVYVQGLQEQELARLAGRAERAEKKPQAKQAKPEPKGR
jgi:hypothetical protein